MYVVLAQNMKFGGIYRLESDLNSECHSEESGSGAMRRYDMIAGISFWNTPT
jgi:hypothetical protein